MASIQTAKDLIDDLVEVAVPWWIDFDGAAGTAAAQSYWQAGALEALSQSHQVAHKSSGFLPMRLLARRVEEPTAQPFQADDESTVGALMKSLLLGDAPEGVRHRLVSRCVLPRPPTPSPPPDNWSRPDAVAAALPPQVYRGRLLRDSSARLRDVCSEGGVVVVLQGRQPAPAPASRQVGAPAAAGCRNRR